MKDQREDVPAGYAAHFRKSPLTEPWEPIYSRVSHGVVYLALYVKRQHCNGRGIAHGGLISTLADNAMGLSVAATIANANEVEAQERAVRGAVTVHLGVDFLGSGKVDDLIEFKPRVLKIGRSLAFTDCIVEASSGVIARANATFRLAD